jgi:hypothetical protein
VNTESGKWICMVCGAKGTIDGYQVDYDAMLEEAWSMLGEESLLKPESWLDQFDSGPVHHYWLSRFTKDVCRRYRLGWDGTKGEPCYPVRAMNGSPLGIVHRNISDPGGPKYKYPRKVHTSDLLFGVPELMQADVLFLVEGAMDVCAVRECGHDAIGSYGSQLHPEQVRQIVALEPRIVFLAYDMDRSGHIGSGKAEWDLGLAGVLTRRIFWDAEYKDLGMMDTEARSDTLAKALASKHTHV